MVTVAISGSFLLQMVSGPTPALFSQAQLSLIRYLTFGSAPLQMR